MIDIIRELHELGVRLMDWDSLPAADALILAVDLMALLDAQALRKEGLRAWRL